MKLKAFSHRLKKLHEKLKTLKVDALFIKNPVDIFYLTNFKVSSGILMVHSKKSKLFVDLRYLKRAQESAQIPAECCNEENKGEFLKKHRIKKLSFDSTYTTYEEYLTLKPFARKNKCILKASSKLLKEIRVCKDSIELKALQQSADLNWKAYKHIQKFFKEGITEEEIAAEYKIYTLKNGASGCSFEPIIAFGKNSAYPHYRAGDCKLKKGDIILMDLGVIFKNYCSDLTRVKFFGTPDPKLAHFYRVVRQAHAAALSLCRPNILIKSLDLVARKKMQDEDLESYFSHSLGHGVGLDIHEFPRIHKEGADKDVALKEGMVITIEPGLYLPGKGGVRYEDTIAITADSYKNFYPEEKS